VTRVGAAEGAELVVELIAKQLGVTAGELTATSSLVDDLHADFFGLVQLALALEEAFGIEIPDEEWIEVTTVSEVVDYVFARVGRLPNGVRRVGADG
jgi:acyl carrier protein